MLPTPTTIRWSMIIALSALRLPAAREEAGELILARQEGLISESHIHAELGEILAGLKAGRQSEEEITLFKSVGIANQDLSAAHAVLARGTRLGLGSSVSL